MILLIILLIGCLMFSKYANDRINRSLYYYDKLRWRKWHDYSLLMGVLILILIFGLLANPVRAQRAIDGDSFYYNGTEYRLACIDAPEWDERGGDVAERYLTRWLPKVTRIEEVGKGYYGRTIVFLWADEVLINARLYQNNLAEYNWGYKCKYKEEILWKN